MFEAPGFGWRQFFFQEMFQVEVKDDLLERCINFWNEISWFHYSFNFAAKFQTSVRAHVEDSLDTKLRCGNVRTQTLC